MSPKKPDAFYIVLTNVSSKPQKVFEDWNSWGYQAISFRVTTEDGKRVVISERQQDFTKNYPSTFTVDPGEHQVFAIHLDNWWEAKPPIPKRNETPITLTVIYELLPSPEAARQSVWTGRVESHEYKLTLWQW